MRLRRSALRRHRSKLWFGKCLVGCLLLTAAVAAPSKSARRFAQKDSSSTSEAVRRNFGGALEVVAAFRPYQVTGDFNGDRVQDLAVVVRITGSRSVLPKDVRLLNPFEPGGAIHFPQSSDNRLAIAILHGWNSPVASAKFLLFGESPILILQYARATSSQEADRSQLLGLRRKTAKRRTRDPLPANAKGDVILLATEVGGDSLLYWNGRTYRWEDVAED